MTVQDTWFDLYIDNFSNQARFYATQLRPSSAPIRRIISLMDNQEPVFAKTDQLSDPQIKDVYPHKVNTTS